MKDSDATTAIKTGISPMLRTPILTHFWASRFDFHAQMPRILMAKQEGTENDRHAVLKFQLRALQEFVPITLNYDRHEGRVMPPQQAAIIMYINRTIKPVNNALQRPENKNISSHYESISSWQRLPRELVDPIIKDVHKIIMP